MARKYSRSASKEVKGAMRKRKRGNLKRGKGGKGGKVKSRKQAIAIGLSEARKKGRSRGSGNLSADHRGAQLRMSPLLEEPHLEKNVDTPGVAKGTAMRKYSALLAAAVLMVSSGIASAQSQTPMNKDKAGAPATSGQSGTQSDPRGTGMTGAPSSTNPQAGGGGAGYQAPRELPEAGGAPNTQNPNPPRR